jgi:hypothetical protein
MSESQNASELLACPFCAKQPVSGTDHCGYIQFYCASGECLNPYTSYCETEEMAIEAWNRRTPPKVGSGELDAAGRSVLQEIWDDATNSVCQTMQERKMCNCPDGDCLAAKVNPGPADFARLDALAAPVDHPEVVGVKIKPLEWVKHPTVEAWRAETLVGLYQVWAVKGISWELSARESTGGKAETIEAAKAAAQQDFETRIRSALTAASLPERVADDSYPDPSDLVAVNKALRQQVSELCAALQPSDSPALEAGVATHRHVKSGHLVRVIGVGKSKGGREMTEAAELIEPKDLVAHVCSVAIGYGVTGRDDLKLEYEEARKELYAHIETLEARVATLSAALVRIEATAKDRSEKAWYRLDMIADEAHYAAREASR